MTLGDARRPAGFLVRPAVPDDVPAMTAIEVDAARRFRDAGLWAVADDPPPPPDVFLAHIALETAWVATEPGPGGTIAVGYALASVVDGDGHLDQVSVLGRAEGRGIGTALVRCVLAWSAALGHPAVTLTTYRDVPWNGPWYGRLGFREMAPDALTSGLAATLAAERAAGLEPPARIAMRRPADP